MSPDGLPYLLRAATARLFGVSSEDARRGRWWEIDLLLVVFLGVFILGAMAWDQLGSNTEPAKQQIQPTVNR